MTYPDNHSPSRGMCFYRRRPRPCRNPLSSYPPPLRTSSCSSVNSPCSPSFFSGPRVVHVLQQPRIWSRVLNLCASPSSWFSFGIFFFFFNLSLLLLVLGDVAHQDLVGFFHPVQVADIVVPLGGRWVNHVTVLVEGIVLLFKDQGRLTVVSVLNLFDN